MLDFLGNLKRTHYCGALRASDAGQNAIVMGWVHRRRDLGNLLFLDLRDRTGIVQVVFNKETQPEAHAKGEQARSEFVVAVEGNVIKRQKANPELATGEVELVATKLHILNNAKTPPFPIEDQITAAEETRLRYRYLDLRRSKPGQADRDRSLGFDTEQWKHFAEGVELAVARCRARGYEPTFHHETGTHVEAPWEIEKVLELTTIGLCLDTGHLLLGGGDPVKAMQDWGDRINHVHLKDARKAVVEQIVKEAAPVAEIWRRKAFCRLGDGDLDVDGVLERLRTGYSGWLVVEQDVLPDPSGKPAADQRANREYLAKRGF